MVGVGGTAVYLPWVNLCSAQPEPGQWLPGLRSHDRRLRRYGSLPATRFCDLGRSHVWLLCLSFGKVDTYASRTGSRTPIKPARSIDKKLSWRKFFISVC